MLISLPFVYFKEIARKIINTLLVKMRYAICKDMIYLGRNRNLYVNIGDYVRISSLELVAYNINENNIEGCVAELGVYKGDFAQHINILFPDRKLYLFDTFEGFDARDVMVDVKNKYSAGTQNFSGTSIELVLNKMRYPKNCLIKKGYFPETTKDIEERFVFVSIDADLLEPIYQGLKYFYPRLQKGGCIFVHDFNNMEYAGAKAAVKKYSMELNIPYFPLSDICGSVVFIK
ncbi:O-methyltransferase [Treponema primitia ZAS-2]|uniref:O-methyltransferase n=1 Tax=Treponema primitia (strain ATCC BAA-887 / DSM 12427 / ZAS-2) TaxID=545694 RepID=F5YNZ3_TREPZ|nr:TylF/MycF/NovP-related O-methyltransferase [Treponema primitia]AEF85675.1 O-methyltransferase [Treponema primitia ZAS-2]